MEKSADLPKSRDKLLFTPGPLTTSLSVKEAMLHDAGSWHYDFNAVVKSVRERLLEVAGLRQEMDLSQKETKGTKKDGNGLTLGSSSLSSLPSVKAPDWECILLQGSGTYGVESVFATCVPPNGKVAVLSNGAYGERMGQMLRHLKIEHVMLRAPEDTPNDPAALDGALSSDSSITHVAVVHCETTTGILNPINEIGAVAKRHGRVFIVDAMSSFGAVPIDFAKAGIDYLISSSNKCIEGVPGFTFVFCRRRDLEACEGYARSLSLDLLGQLKGFDKNGQFRYTPPTHVILAFDQALKELELEGGVAARGARYQRNHQVLVEGMRKLRFQPYLDTKVQSYFITSFRYPDDPRFQFDLFYRKLSDKGFIIYPGKISTADTFRIGSIGRIFEADIRSLLAAVAETVQEMGLSKD